MGSKSPQLCVSRGTGKAAQSRATRGATYSASSLEIRFPEYKTSAIRDTMGSQFRLAAAVTKPSLKEKAEGRGSQHKYLSGAAAPCHPQARCVLGGSGQGGRCLRVPKDLQLISWGWAPSLGAEGEETCPRPPAQLVSPSQCWLFPFWLWGSVACVRSPVEGAGSSASSPFLPCLFCSEIVSLLVFREKMHSPGRVMCSRVPTAGRSAGREGEDSAPFPERHRVGAQAGCGFTHLM